MKDDSSPESAAARAMDRVLAAERAAQAEISACEREAAATLERARQERQAILDRARARIVALHARAAGTLTERAAAIAAQRGQSAKGPLAGASNSTRRTKALETLAVRLTSGNKKSQDGI